ncbi:MAG: hypoxanthine phosphoribosyltransferase [Firmicutes bacterium]|nr:hypoxanthine phosphoribosyltransferase [Bacillota bacterium]
MESIKVLIDEETLQSKVAELAEQIMKDYAGKEVTLICILKGSMFFTVDLARRLKNVVNIDCIMASSYGENTISSGEVEIKLDLKNSIEGQDVIVVEDIIDTGNTLAYLLEHLQKKNPKTLKLCALLSKPERREVEIDVNYIGFEIPNKFVVGYGLDFNEEYRNLPYIGYLE